MHTRFHRSKAFMKVRARLNAVAEKGSTALTVLEKKRCFV